MLLRKLLEALDTGYKLHVIGNGVFTGRGDERDPVSYTHLDVYKRQV